MQDAAAIAFLSAHRRTIAYAINAMCVPHRYRDDIRQDVACRVITRFRNKGELVPEGNSGFAGRLARSAVVDHFRKHMKERPTIAAETLDRIMDRSQRPDEIMERKSTGEVLHRAIACLTPVKRHIVRRVMEGYSMVEVAEELGRTHGSVKVLHHRAMNELKGILKGK